MPKITLDNASDLVKQHTPGARLSRNKPVRGRTYYTVHGLGGSQLGCGATKRHAWKDAAINMGLDL